MELGAAYVSIVAEMKGLNRDVQKSLGGVEAEFSKAGKKSGGFFSNALSTAVGLAGGKALAAVGATVGQAFTKGLDRYMKIENAEAKLKALGNSADDVKRIMEGANKAVKGTAFGMGEAADTAAAAVASGIQPGERLDQVLRTIANTAAIAGTDMASMGAIFNKAAASGKVQGDILAQLGERQIPAVQYLAKELGVTAEQVYELASAGKISFDQFERAMRNGMDPNAAVMMGNTLKGSWENAQAALGRLGAEFMKVFGPIAKTALDGLISGLDTVTKGVGVAFKGIGEAVKIIQYGDYSGGIFGLREDSPVMRALLLMHKVVNDVGNAVDVIRTGDYRGGIFGLEEDSPVVLALLSVHRFIQDIKAAVDGISSGGGPGLSAILGPDGGSAVTATLDNIRGALGGLWQGITTQVLPAAAELGRALGQGWTPILQGAASLLTGVLIPAFIALGRSLSTSLRPAVDLIVGVFTKVIQIVTQVYQTVAPIVQQIVATIVGKFREMAPQINAAMTQIGSIVRDVFALIQAIVAWVMPIIQGIISAALAVIRFVWDSWGQSILAILRTVMDLVMGVIRGALNIVQGIIRTVLAIIRGDWSAAWDGIKQILSGAWQIITSILRAAINIFVALLQGLWNTVRNLFQVGINFVVGLWQRFWDGLRATGDRIMGLIRSGIDAGLNAVRGFFQNAVDGIGRIWDGLKEKARAPVAFVINTVINGGLIRGWNAVASAVGLKRLDPIPGLAGGGLAKLPWSARERDPYLGFTPRGAFRFEGEEFIVNRASTRKMEKKHRGLLAYVNEHGDLPTFAAGGSVFPVPGYRVSRGAHGVDRGVDIAAPMGAAVVATRPTTITSTARWGNSYGWHIRTALGEIFAHLSQILVNAGQNVAAGQRIGSIGSTGNSTGPHLHYVGSGAAAGSGGTVGGGFIQQIVDYASQFKDSIAGPLGRLRELGNTPWAEFVGGMARKIGEAMTGKVTSAFAAIRDSITSVGAGIATGARAMFGGHAVDPATALMLGKAQQILGRNFVITQGSFSTRVKASGSTHSGAGAVDIGAPISGAAVDALRKVGFAAWFRPNRPGVWGPHIHAIANVPGMSASARAQYLDFLRGGDGLLKGGLVTSSGASWLSEDGRPELVIGPQVGNLRAGTQVLDAEKTAAIMRGGTVNLTINNPLSEPTSDSIMAASGVIGYGLAA